MKAKRILLVTSSYPYGVGESFLTAELKCMSRYFESIELAPSYYSAGQERRSYEGKVNVRYADARWGALRKWNVLTSLVMGTATYPWTGELLHILQGSHKRENIKELIRALYRARMFEQFLKEQIAQNKTRFDLIYFYWMVPEIMGAIALRASAHLTFKVIARAHGGDLYEATRAGQYFGLRGGIARGIDAVYCISGHGKAYLQRRYASLEKKCWIAKLGVGEPGFINLQPDGNGLSIVSCSFVSEVKRVHLITGAIGYLAHQYPLLKLKWTHIGDGPLFEQVRTDAFTQLRGRADILFTGYLTQDQIMDLYRSERFDVFVNLSSSEGLPVSLMEASAVGVPAVATDVGGSAEIVGPHNGILLPADPAVDAIAFALHRFENKEWARDLRQHARQLWDEKFNAEKNHDLFARELLILLESE